MKTKIILFCFFIFCLEVCYGADDTGTSTAEFLKITGSVRGASLGDAFVAVPGGIDSITYNPAGLSAVKQFEGAISYSPYLADTSFFSFTGALNITGIGALGLTLSDLFYGSIPETLENSSGSLITTGNNNEPNDLLLVGTYSGSLITDWLSIGMNFKYITLGAAGERGNGIAFDGGLQYYQNDDHWGLGIALNNIGTKINYGQRQDSIPMILRIGTYYNCEIEQKHTLLFLLGMEEAAAENSSANIGIEYCYNKLIFIRTGYETNRDIGGYSLGLGINYSFMRFDYGFSLYGELGMVHRLQISIILPGSEQKPKNKDVPKKANENKQPVDFDDDINTLIK